MAAHPVDGLVRRAVLAREGLLAAVAALDQAACDRRPAPGRWSPGEVLDHLAQSEAGVVKVLGRLLRQAGSGPPDADLPAQDERLAFATLGDRTRRYDAPDAVRPRAGRAKETLLIELAGSRIALLDAARRMHGADLRGTEFPHPLLGSLDAYQWLLFVAEHEARHTAQIVEAVS